MIEYRVVKFSIMDFSVLPPKIREIEIRFGIRDAIPKAVIVDGELWTTSSASERTDR